MSTSPPPLLGKREPRVSSIPPAHDSLGFEAITLAARARLKADPWQEDVLKVILSVKLDGKWAAPEVGVIVPRQNGKGTILEIRALAGMFILGEPLIIWSAHQYKTAMEGFRRTKTLIQRLGKRVKPSDDTLYLVDGSLIKVHNTNGEEGFERLDTEQRIRFVARSASSGRGFSGDVNIIDEAFAYTSEQQEALMPTLSARPDPQIIYTSSPPLDALTGEPMFNLKDRGEAGDDPELAWFDWGAPSGVDPNDREEWARSNPALGIRITEAVVAREHRSMTGPGFSRERLGVWPVRKADKLLSPQDWSAIVDVASKRSGAVAAGVEITPMRTYGSIAIYGLRGDELGHIELIKHRAGTQWLIEEIGRLIEVHDLVAVGLNPGGPAASLLADLEKAGIVPPEDPDKPKSGDLWLPTGRELAAATGSFVDAVRHKTIRQIDQPEMSWAVAGAKPRPTGDGVVWSQRSTSVIISPLIAGTVAKGAFEARAHMVVKRFNAWDHVY